MISFIKAKLLLLLVFIFWLWLALAFLPVTVLVTVLPMFIKRRSLARWRLHFWLGQDQFINAIFFGNPDVTISSRVGWLSRNGSKTAKVAEQIIDLIFYLAVNEVGHCANSYESTKKHNKVRL